MLQYKAIRLGRAFFLVQMHELKFSIFSISVIMSLGICGLGLVHYGKEMWVQIPIEISSSQLLRA